MYLAAFAQAPLIWYPAYSVGSGKVIEDCIRRWKPSLDAEGHVHRHELAWAHASVRPLVFEALAFALSCAPLLR